jgi:hypothetical protein
VNSTKKKLYELYELYELYKHQINKSTNQQINKRKKSVSLQIVKLGDKNEFNSNINTVLQRGKDH